MFVKAGRGERVAVTLKEVVRVFRAAGASPAALLAVTAYAQHARGRLRGALRAYERALGHADRTGGRWVFRARQSWQFALERLHAELGAPRVEDPLFNCRAVAEPQVGQATRGGSFRVEWTHLGMRVDGFIGPGRSDVVALRVDGELLRRVPVIRFPVVLPGYFTFHVKRPTLAKFPRSSLLTAELLDGRALYSDGASALRLHVPHGSGQLIAQLRSGGRIDKKGFLAGTPEEVAARQQQYLEVYDKARVFFERELGKPLFLMYGTLLGQHRDGDLIPGDDDFDAGYMSDANDPIAVKEEAKRIVLRLVEAGFTVTFNRQGRLFRLKCGASGDDVHLDVRPLWYQRGRIWAHKQAAVRCTVADFLPVQRATLRGYEVNVPNNPEAFLAAYYGPDWRVPDPTYTNSARVPIGVRRNLAKACITPKEYRQMLEELAASDKAANSSGRLISLGLHDLYPLEEYERYCEW